MTTTPQRATTSSARTPVVEREAQLWLSALAYLQLERELQLEPKLEVARAGRQG